MWGDAKLFLLPAGLVLGLVFAASMVSGPVWIAQLGYSGRYRSAMAAAVGISLAQGVWAFIAGAVLFSLGQALYWRIEIGFRLGAVLLLGYLTVHVVRARRVEQARIEVRDDRVFWNTLRRATRMPMRFGAFMALFVAVNLPMRISGVENAVLLSLGILGGNLLWGAFFASVSALGRNVPEEVCVRSLNKLKTLAVTVLAGLAVIAAVPLFFARS